MIHGSYGFALGFAYAPHTVAGESPGATLGLALGLGLGLALDWALAWTWVGKSRKTARCNFVIIHNLTCIVHYPFMNNTIHLLLYIMCENTLHLLLGTEVNKTKQLNAWILRWFSSRRGNWVGVTRFLSHFCSPWNNGIFCFLVYDHGILGIIVTVED